MKTWEKEFFETIRVALKKEQDVLNEVNLRHAGYHALPTGIAGIMEVALVFAVFKETLNNPFFKEWSVGWEDNYPKRKYPRSKHRKGPGLRADITLAHRRRAGNKAPWYYIEFGRYTGNGLKKYYDKLLGLGKQRNVSEGEKINVHGSYIVLYSDRANNRDRLRKTKSLRQNIEDNPLWNKGVKWVDTHKHVRNITIRPYQCECGKCPKDAKGIFEIAFLRVTDGKP